MKHLTSLVLLAALGATVSACNSQPTTPVTAQAAQDDAILVVNSHLAGMKRQVLADAATPLTLGDIHTLRIRLIRGDAEQVFVQKIADPAASTSAAFRNLRANTTYTVEADAFTAVLGDVLDEGGSPVASDTTTVTVGQSLTPSFAGLTLQLPNVTFDSRTDNTIAIEDATFVYPVDGSGNPLAEEIIATPPSL